MSDYDDSDGPNDSDSDFAIESSKTSRILLKSAVFWLRLTAKVTMATCWIYAVYSQIF